jgi:hypothetical protein
MLTAKLVNYLRIDYLSEAHVTVLSLCGVRGSMALALSIKASRDFSTGKGHELFSCTLVYALITILPLGSFMPKILRSINFIPTDQVQQSFLTEESANYVKNLIGYVHHDILLKLFVVEELPMVIGNQQKDIEGITDSGQLDE